MPNLVDTHPFSLNYRCLAQSPFAAFGKRDRAPPPAHAPVGEVRPFHTQGADNRAYFANAGPLQKRMVLWCQCSRHLVPLILRWQGRHATRFGEEP